MTTGKRVAGWHPDTHKMNPEELGSYASGDILIPANTSKVYASYGRNGLTAPSARWPRGVIPFTISRGFSEYSDHLFIWH